MKSSFAAAVLAVAGAYAAPVADTNTETIPEGGPLSLVHRFDASTTAGPGDGWLFTPPGLPKGAMVKFYQNNQLLNGKKGRAYIIEIQEDVDIAQVKASTNARPVLTERQVAPYYPYSLPQRQAVPQQGPGYVVAPNTLRPSAVAPAAPGCVCPANSLVAQSALTVAPAQGAPTISGLITQAGNLIGSQIGISIGGLIGNTLESVVVGYFPPPKPPGQA